MSDLPTHWTVVSGPVSGGQASVYRVHRSSDDSLYALKRLTDPSRGGRFRREIATMQQLSAAGVPGLPPVIETGRTPGRRARPYYVLPWYQRGSLQTVLDESPRTDWRLPDRLDLLVGLAELLEGVHLAGVSPASGT